MSPTSNIGSQNQCVQIRYTEQSAVKIGESSQVEREIRSQNQRPYQVHGIIQSENQAYTDLWYNVTPEVGSGAMEE